MTTYVLFICLGNICRSPTAEGVFRGLAVRAGADVVVDSAGTSGWHNGQLPDGRSMGEAARRGYDLSDQRSRKLVQADFGAFDLIIGMDHKNMADLRELAPKGCRAKIKLFLDYAPMQDIREVPDPYFEDDFDGVFELIELASRGLLDSL